MAKKFPPDATGNTRKRSVADPCREPPRQVIGGNEGNEKSEGGPDCLMLRGIGESIDKFFNPVLRRNGKRDRGSYGEKDRDVRPPITFNDIGNETVRMFGKCR